MRKSAGLLDRMKQLAAFLIAFDRGGSIAAACCALVNYYSVIPACF